MTPQLEVRGLTRTFALRRGPLRRTAGVVRAVDGVDLTIAAGETYALVGESGCGKTTLGRCILRLIEPTRGTVRLAGEDLTALGRRQLRRRRRAMQMIFQDPASSLNPRHRVATLVAEPLRAHRLGDRRWRRDEVSRLLSSVGLSPELARRFPHQLSGGQRQRVGIARALATRPDLVVADEPLSALDAPIRARILDLLGELRRELGLTLLFISHDLALVERIADRVGVMYLGRLVEEGPAAEVLRRPLHPYTAALLSAVPVPDPASGRRRLVLTGEPASAAAPPRGCAFHPRCPIAVARCARHSPPLTAASSARPVACHFPGEAVFAGGPKLAP